MSDAMEEFTIQVNVSSDGSQAQIVLPANCPKELVTDPMCHQALTGKEVEVTETVVKAIEKLIAGYQTSDQPQAFVVAKATQPVHGQDGYIQWLVDDQQADQADDQQQAQADTDAQDDSQEDQTNYYDNSAYIMVKDKQHIATVHPPIIGEDGRDVRGKTLAAKTGKPFGIALDETILAQAEGKIVAMVEGVLVRKNDKATIRQVIQVDGYVDFSTGNIDFSGDVNVSKGVRDCFEIKAGGTVEVAGLIEAAVIDCGGDLVARGGFAGKEQGSAKVGGNLIGRYLDNIKGTIDGDLVIQKEVINCEFCISGAIDSPGGSILGGNYTVTGAVIIATIGSPAAITTELILGTVPRLDPYSKHFDPVVGGINQHFEKLQKEKETLTDESRRLTATDKERQTEIEFELFGINDSLIKAKAISDVVSEKIREKRTVDLTVEKMLHGGTKIFICGQGYDIRSDVKGPVHITLNEKDEPVYTKAGDDAPHQIVQIASTLGKAA